jgi:uncharacterized protein (TIGR03067 family)
MSRHLRDVLLAKDYEVHYQEFAGGHDFLNWRGSLAEGLLVLLGTPDDPENDQARKDAEALKGTWSMVSLTLSGREMPEGQVSTASMVVQGNGITTTWAGRDSLATFKLDPAMTPRTIDLTFSDGPLKDQTVKGIYKFDGNHFVMCRAARPEGERPGEFTSQAASGRILAVWQRKEP